MANAVKTYNGGDAFTLKPNGMDSRTVNKLLYTPNQVPLSGLQIYYDPAHPDCYPGTGTTLTDLMGNYNSTIGGGMESSYTQNGWFTNDGVNDGITSATTIPLDSTGALGWGIWFQYGGLTTTQLLLDDYFNNGSGDRYGMRIFYFSGNLNFQFTQGNNNPFALTPYISPNTWYFLFGQTKYVSSTTRANQLWLGDGSGITQLYNNGSFSSNATATTTQNETLGLTDFKTSGASWGGKIGEAWRYYNHTLLTTTQVTSIFNNTKQRYGY
jgi:hypothetical protein